MQHLTHTNIKRNENLYLEKSVSQNYVSKFLSYDKHTVKKKVFFYYNLIRLTNNGKKNQTKFLCVPKLEIKRSSLLRLTPKSKKKKFLILSSKTPKSCKMHNHSISFKYDAYLNLGISCHNDPFRGYKKGKANTL